MHIAQNYISLFFFRSSLNRFKSPTRRRYWPLKLGIIDQGWSWLNNRWGMSYITELAANETRVSGHPKILLTVVNIRLILRIPIRKIPVLLNSRLKKKGMLHISHFVHNWRYCVLGMIYKHSRSSIRNCIWKKNLHLYKLLFV